MAPQVQLHAAAKTRLAEVRLEHREHARALLIRDLVEGPDDLPVLIDWLVHGAPDPKRIRVHGLERRSELFGAGAEPRPPAVADLRAEPLREGFIEPDIVPPDRRDEDAVQLLRNLLRHDSTKDALLRRGGARADQQVAIIENDRACVLHRDAVDRGGDQIQLRIRKGETEVFLEPKHELARVPGGEGEPLALSSAGHESERQ